MDGEYQVRVRKLDEVMQHLPATYQRKDRLRGDVAQLLRSVRTLQPQTGTFAGGGAQHTLFYLFGVLPITYRGTTYNIPVTIYFDPPYPSKAPRCFVTPTGDMAISQNHSNVDKGGMVYCPYLASWNERSSSLAELVGIMTSLFCANPPVYSTAGGARPQQPAAGAAATAGVGGLFGAIGELFGGGGGHDHQHRAGQHAAAATPVVAAQVQARPVNQKEQLVRRAAAALKERWPLVVEPLVAEANDQISKRKELRAASKKMEEHLEKLNLEEQEQTSQAQRLEAAETRLAEFVAAGEGREPQSIDLRSDLGPDGEQALDLLAEELALDEFLVALDELLAAKKVSIDDFVREVRQVGRKRFLCQVLRRKSEAAIRAGAEATAVAV